MKRNRRSCGAAFIFFSAFGLCLGALIAGLVISDVFGRVERTFGPPSANLDALDRVYFSALVLLHANDLTLPHDTYGQEQTFAIEMGEPPGAISARLQSQGLIGSAEAFRSFLVYSGLDTTIQAGSYQLSSGMTSMEIAYSLQDATPSEVTFRILPGWRVEEVAAALPTSGFNIQPATLIDAVQSPPEGADLPDGLPLDSPLEGFLFPDIYQLPRAITADALVIALLENFENQVGEDLRQGFARQGLSLFEAATLASIVEREAVVDDEMPLIASVFLNRLAAGMKLDSDPTVQYALGFIHEQDSWWKNPLSLEDLRKDSLYNTYIYPGLPPGPIANPGINALQAVAFPAQSPYFYFRAACDDSGKHLFSETFEEHVNNACP